MTSAQILTSGRWCPAVLALAGLLPWCNIFHSRNNQVLAWLEAYARGRTEPDDAFGSSVYLMNMDLYTTFVSSRLIHDPLAFERSRMGTTNPTPR